MTPFDDVDELVVAHPSRVAAADQIRAAEPRLNRGEVVLRDWVPESVIYVVNAKQLREQLAADLDRMRFFP